LRDALAIRRRCARDPAREGYGQETRRVIAADTNVLLRRLLNATRRDAMQAEKARRLFETQEPRLTTKRRWRLQERRRLESDA